MAASTSVHSLLSLPTTRVGQKTKASLPHTSIRFSRKGSNMGVVRCMGEDNVNPSEAAPKTPSSAAPQTPPPSTPPPAPKVKKVSTKFSDVLAFSGPAPERINGRLAMIGFVAAIAAELAKGDDVVAQIANGGLPWFVGTSVVLSLASLIPMFKGVSVESKSNGVMTSDAEMWNGRFAMLGLVGLVFTEFVKGSPLV